MKNFVKLIKNLIQAYHGPVSRQRRAVPIVIIALVALFVFSIAACAGTAAKVEREELSAELEGLTITGLDEYNGYFILAQGWKEDHGDILAAIEGTIVAGGRFGFTEQIIGGEIKNGSVTLPVWTRELLRVSDSYEGYYLSDWDWDEETETETVFHFIWNYARFNESGDVNFEATILKNEDYQTHADFHNEFVTQGSVSVTFENGIAKGVFEE